MDEKKSSSSSQDPTFSVLESGETCDNCNSTNKVQKFDGQKLCKNCRNQWAAMQ